MKLALVTIISPLLVGPLSPVVASDIVIERNIPGRPTSLLGHNPLLDGVDLETQVKMAQDLHDQINLEIRRLQGLLQKLRAQSAEHIEEINAITDEIDDARTVFSLPGLEGQALSD